MENLDQDPLIDHETRLQNENLEIRLLLEAIYEKYGYDFRNYGKAHVKRRVMYRLANSHLASIAELMHKALYDRNFYYLLLQDLSINVTEMFRDPSFYKAVRRRVIPVLKTYPYLKVWHAGCATGEEVYSMAILLIEEEMYKKARIYATDFNPVVVQKAKDGIYSLEKIREYTSNYLQAGGTSSFSDYYTAKYESVIIDNAIKKNIVFSDHNLVTDGVFGEMNVIVCRNVLIYFNKPLQNQVVKLLYDSLAPGGYLCLGSKESLRFTEYEDLFEELVPEEKIYKKKYLDV